MRNIILAGVFPVLALTVVAVSAADEVPAEVRARIASGLNMTPDSIKPGPVPGLYEVSSGTEVGYVSADGRFYIDGDIYDMASKANLTESSRKGVRADLLNKFGDDQAIVFSPKGYKYTVSVFTDIDCGYCRKLHAEIAELNRLGVRVRYFMYPRGGPGSEAWRKAEAVWCSADRRDAMTRAKLGENVTAAKCATPVARQYQLGRDLGIRGTPGIITEDGEYIAGYMPAPKLVEHLRALKGQG